MLRTEGARLAGRLEREAMVSASVVHPNVIHLHDMGRTPEGRPYLAFSLASDGSMLDHAGRPPRWGELKQLLIGLLDALGALHARSLLHLDVKLSNLLLHRVGPRHRVLWLADLGVARARFTEEEDEGMVLGTVGYMAPERLTGQHQLWGPPTDLFSVGAVLYRLLTGELPFPAKDPVEALSARQRPPGQVPIRDKLRVPAGLEDIVLALLQPDRRSRYDLAADVARAIEELPDPDDGPILSMPGEANPPRLALMKELGEDSLVEWPPPDHTAPRPVSEIQRLRASVGIVWRKPPPLRPPRRRPRPFVPRRVPQDPRLVMHREIPVVGRDKELDLLWSAARAVLRHRRPVMVTLQGQRGTGGTRLVDEITRTLERVGIATGVRMDHGGREGPAQGLEGAVRRLLPPLPDARAYRNDVARTLSRLRDSRAAACRNDAAALADWVSPRAGAPAPDRGVVRSFVAEHLVTHAWRGLSWLWLDDLHLASESDDAWAIVDMLFASDAPVLILATVEQGAARGVAMRPLRRLEARYPKRCQRLTLDRLKPDAARRMAQAHLPMSDDLAFDLALRTRGHPRFLHDLIVHLVRRGDLIPGHPEDTDSAVWRLSPDAPVLPRDRDEFAGQRLEQALADDTEMRHALLTVRLAGTGAPEAVVARVIGDQLDAIIADGLLRVEQGGLVWESPELKRAVSALPRDGELEVLIHETLAAAWDEEGDDPQAEARAGLHLALAGRHAEALPKLRRALKRLQGTLRPLPLARIAARTMDLARDAGEEGRTAWVEAALVRAEALWSLGSDDEAIALDDRIQATPLDPEQAVLAACLHAVHLAARDSAGTVGLARLARVEGVLGRVPSPVRARFHATRALLQSQRLEREATLDDIASALHYAPRPDTRAEALLLRAELLAGTDPVVAADTAREVQELARQHGLLRAEVDAWDILARLAVGEGRVDEAIAELETGIVRLRRVGERAAVGHLLATLGTLRRNTGDLAAARTAYRDALALEATGREGFARSARLGLAVLAAIAGDGGRIRLLGESAGPSVEPRERRMWTLLRALASSLDSADPPELPAWDALAHAAGTDAEGRFLVEALQRRLIELDDPRADELRGLLDRVAEDHPVDEALVGTMLLGPQG
ncbi:MAG: AAA family ATPase [Alphaproteobacteria bacterium]|nr:AAA family ATPase [Alphaproteobacteria bacterium]